MIKIFGKIRYHWQPDLSMLITYWSLSVIPVFIGLALMYESSNIPTVVLFSFFLFMALLAVGVHRYFTIYDDGILRIITANPLTPIKVPISSIEKVEVTKNSIKLIFNDITQHLLDIKPCSTHLLRNETCCSHTRSGVDFQ